MAQENKFEKLLITTNPAMRTVPPELRIRVWRRLAVNRIHSFMYVRIPKAANSTVTLTLARMLFPDKTEQLVHDVQGKVARKLFSTPEPLRHFGARAFRRGLRTFSFFRNPYTRLLSAYLDKLCSDENRDSYQWVAQAAGYADNSEMTFERFVEYLEKGRNVYSNIHWAPQTAICPIAIDRLDLIGQLENLEGDLERLTGLLLGKPSPVTVLSREQNRQGAQSKLQRYYTPQLMGRVHHLYAEDFTALGYDPAPETYLG